MPIKKENEITVKVICPDEELKNILKSKGFTESECFSLDDRYLVPDDPQIDKLTVRETLAKAVIIRTIRDDGGEIHRITFKKKDINSLGEIVSQQACSCGIKDPAEALALFTELGYREIMELKENDIVYSKGEIDLAVKFAEGSDTLIEFETNEHFDTAEKLKAAMGELDIPVDMSDCFVKKAEIALARIRNNQAAT